MPDTDESIDFESDSTQKPAESIIPGEKLDDIDKEIVRLKLENPSITKVELAKRMDLDRATIAKRLNKPAVEFAISELKKTALQVLLDTQAAAARKLREIIRTSADHRAVIAACKEVLKGVLSENVNLNLNRGHFQKWVESLSDEDVGDLLSDD